MITYSKQVIIKHTKILLRHSKELKKHSKLAIHISLEILLGYIIYYIFGGNLGKGTISDDKSVILWNDISTWDFSQLGDLFTIILTVFFIHSAFEEIKSLLKNGKKNIDIGTLFIFFGFFTTFTFLLGNHFGVSLIPTWITNWNYDIALFIGLMVVWLFRKMIKIYKKDEKINKEDRKVLIDKVKKLEDEIKILKNK